MNEREALEKMVAPGTRRRGKYREGVIQIHITRACDNSCYNCTQGSNYGGKTSFMSPDQFREACRSLRGYFGVVGMFGGNPALHPQFSELCRIMREEVPDGHRGIWCNNPITVENAREMRRTFDPSYSNLNVHLDKEAFRLFKEGWPECGPVGLVGDSRHSPVFVAMKDVLKKDCPTCIRRNRTHFFVDPGPCSICGTAYKSVGRIYDKELAWRLISNCDINQHWSAMIGVFRRELRAWFCEVAGAQSILHQWDECTCLNGDIPMGHGPCKRCNGTGYSYPDTGLDPTIMYEHEVAPGDRLEVTVGKWWQLGMQMFADQVRKHCHECGVPLRGYGELACSTDPDSKEQFSETHANVAKPKRKGRKTEIVTDLLQLGTGKLRKTTRYLQNASE